MSEPLLDVTPASTPDGRHGRTETHGLDVRGDRPAIVTPTRPPATIGEAVQPNGAIKEAVNRFSQFALVALMGFSASGLADLAVPEPCQLVESTTEQDSDCPATCVRCMCCAQSIEILTVRGVSTPVRFVADAVAAPRSVLPGDTAEILHVPRPSVL